jgi:hypothetical protein
VRPDLNSKLQSLQKKWTKIPYLVMLFIIGRSQRPLSSYEIKTKTQGASYAYRMLNALTGIPQEPFNGILTEPRLRRHNREANERWQREYRLCIKRPSRGRQEGRGFSKSIQMKKTRITGENGAIA